MTARHLFLKGPSGAGKSTLLLSCLEPFWEGATGVFSQRLLDENGETRGFCLVSLEGTKKPPAVSRLYDPQIPGIFIERTKEGFKKRPQVFDELGTAILDGLLDRLLMRDPFDGFCYLDEIGGVELEATGYMDRLMKLLLNAPACIGVLKASPNLAAMQLRVSRMRSLIRERDGLELRMEEDLGCHIYPFTGEEMQKQEIRSILRRLFMERKG